MPIPAVCYFLRPGFVFLPASGPDRDSALDPGPGHEPDHGHDPDHPGVSPLGPLDLSGRLDLRGTTVRS